MLQIAATVVLGLMCGSELNIAAFAHPSLSRESLNVHIAVRASLGALLGFVMPFWMASSTILNLLLLLPFEHLTKFAWRLTLIAFLIQVFAGVFSLFGPVPINNRIAKWTAQSLPDDWKAQEHRWDAYHWFRTCGLIVAFIILVASIAAR